MDSHSTEALWGYILYPHNAIFWQLPYSMTTTNLRTQLLACHANEAVEEPETSGATKTVQPHLSAYFFPLSSSGPPLEAARNEAIVNKIARLFFLYKNMWLISADSIQIQ